MRTGELDLATYEIKGLGKNGAYRFIEDGQTLLSTLRKKAESLGSRCGFILPRLSSGEQKSLLQLMVEHGWVISIGKKSFELDAEQQLRIPYFEVMVTP